MRNRSTVPHSSQLKRKWMGICFLCMLLLLLSACGDNTNETAGEQQDNTAAEQGKDSESSKADPDAVVASYEGGQVTRGELDGFLGVNLFFNGTNPYFLQYMQLNPNYEKEMLDQFIGLRLLAEDATDQMREDALQFRETQLGSLDNATAEQKKQLEDQLKQLDITLDDIGNYYEMRQLAFDVLDEQVNDQSIEDEYNRLLEADEYAFTMATVSHILIKTDDPTTGESTRTKEEALARANEVKQKLDAGEDFAALVSEYSEDEGSKQTGGTYEDAPVSGWVEGFKEAAATLPLNEISEPVETAYGYHIIKVLERTTQKLEDVKEQLRAQVTGNLFAEFVEKEVPERTDTVNLPDASKQG